MRKHVSGLALFVAWVVFGAGCGGSSSTSNSASNPAAPTSSAAQVCRTYATSSTTVTTTSQGGGNSRTLNCSFNTSSNQLACTMTISTCGAVSFSVSYASRGDFVDEVSSIPPRQLQTAQTTAANSCGITNATYNYDSQKRLLNYSINGLTYSYSAWDSAGRPTTGVVAGPTAPVGEQWSYNDGTRTAVLVQSVTGGSTTTTYIYDTNGNPVSVVTIAGGTIGTSTTTTASTAQVCK